MTAADESEERETQRLDAAWTALEEGDVERALREVEAVSPDLSESWLVRVEAWISLGDLVRAEAELERGRAHLGPRADDLLASEAFLRVQQWRLAEARSLYERAEERAPSVVTAMGLALVADAEDRVDDGHRWLEEAHRREGLEAPKRLTPAEFEAIVDRAARELPQEFRAALEEVPVLIDPMPTPALLGGQDFPPDVLGFCSGVPLSERASSVSGELQPTIHLFQRNLEREYTRPEELVEQIRTTLYHELGHALGFDEEGVEDMGLG